MYCYKRFKRSFEIQTFVCDQRMTGGDGWKEKIGRKRKSSSPQRAGASSHDPVIASAAKHA
jgi:hypothetical protein